MIIKKFIAATQEQAEQMAKAELGQDAIVMNVKTIKPGGFVRMFKKPRVEVTAAIDDNISKDTKTEEKKVSFEDESRKLANNEDKYRFGEGFVSGKDKFLESNDSSKNADALIEEKINTIARLLDQQSAKKEESTKTVSASATSAINKYTVASAMPKKETEKVVAKEESDSSEAETIENKVISLIKSQLMENEVSEKNADIIISELEVPNSTQALDVILSSVYQKIVLKLGQIEPLALSEEKPKIIFFVGNTGVGKTTTMAKIASKCTLEDKAKVALFSVDTYRIAAKEQIKTYANILSTPMEIVYTPEEMKKYVEKYKDYDVIMVDTAGRSHANDDQRQDLLNIINSVPDCDKEIYLVVSATTKYSDLLNIAKTYGDMFDYRLIFTKLDETRGLGNILNLRLDTDKTLSYVTWGQNVPDDIGELNPQVIAKKLLGGAD